MTEANNSLFGSYVGQIKGVRIGDDHNQTDDPTSVKPPYFAPAEKEFISAMQMIARRWGKLADYDDNGIYVGYVPAVKNENRSKGIYCEHCAHYESDNVCKIIAAQIEPGGYCRLAAIPSELVTVRGKKK